LEVRSVYPPFNPLKSTFLQPLNLNLNLHNTYARTDTYGGTAATSGASSKCAPYSPRLRCVPFLLLLLLLLQYLS
jgi:hypothetical protein